MFDQLFDSEIFWIQDEIKEVKAIFGVDIEWLMIICNIFEYIIVEFGGLIFIKIFIKD
jgi:hypothetical protein